MKKVGVLHVITDCVVQSRFTHIELVKMAIKGGADTIQFRQKTGTTRQLCEIAQQVRVICAKKQASLIINDRIDIALATGASGVHLGQEDLPVALARQMMPEDAIIGASARTEKDILKAVYSGADYIGFGPVFKTLSKGNAEEPKGLEQLKKICQLVTCPVIAIGGIDLNNIYEVIKAGAYGVAVISAVCGKNDPEKATRELIIEIQRAKNEIRRISKA